ncbi:hypothetical protein DIPPA_30483 [Diplonema papillatum]|nr:hypothetical protein DIPPA_30483 [Diplonema papillatum]
MQARVVDQFEGLLTSIQSDVQEVLNWHPLAPPKSEWKQYLTENEPGTESVVGEPISVQLQRPVPIVDFTEFLFRDTLSPPILRTRMTASAGPAARASDPNAACADGSAKPAKPNGGPPAAEPKKKPGPAKRPPAAAAAAAAQGKPRLSATVSAAPKNGRKPGLAATVPPPKAGRSKGKPPATEPAAAAAAAAALKSPMSDLPLRFPWGAGSSESLAREPSTASHPPPAGSPQDPPACRGTADAFLITTTSPPRSQPADAPFVPLRRGSYTEPPPIPFPITPLFKSDAAAADFEAAGLPKPETPNAATDDAFGAIRPSFVFGSPETPETTALPLSPTEPPAFVPLRRGSYTEPPQAQYPITPLFKELDGRQLPAGFAESAAEKRQPAAGKKPEAPRPPKRRASAQQKAKPAKSLGSKKRSVPAGNGAAPPPAADGLSAAAAAAPAEPPSFVPLRRGSYTEPPQAQYPITPLFKDQAAGEACQLPVGFANAAEKKSGRAAKRRASAQQKAKDRKSVAADGLFVSTTPVSPMDLPSFVPLRRGSYTEPPQAHFPITPLFRDQTVTEHRQLPAGFDEATPPQLPDGDAEAQPAANGGAASSAQSDAERGGEPAAAEGPAGGGAGGLVITTTSPLSPVDIPSFVPLRRGSYTEPPQVNFPITPLFRDQTVTEHCQLPTGFDETPQNVQDEDEPAEEVEAAANGAGSSESATAESQKSPSGRHALHLTADRPSPGLFIITTAPLSPADPPSFVPLRRGSYTEPPQAQFPITPLFRDLAAAEHRQLPPVPPPDGLEADEAQKPAAAPRSPDPSSFVPLRRGSYTEPPQAQFPITPLFRQHSTEHCALPGAESETPQRKAEAFAGGSDSGESGACRSPSESEARTPPSALLPGDLDLDGAAAEEPPAFAFWQPGPKRKNVTNTMFIATSSAEPMSPEDPPSFVPLRRGSYTEPPQAPFPITPLFRDWAAEHRELPPRLEASPKKDRKPRAAVPKSRASASHKAKAPSGNPNSNDNGGKPPGEGKKKLVFDSDKLLHLPPPVLGASAEPGEEKAAAADAGKHLLQVPAPVLNVPSPAEDPPSFVPLRRGSYTEAPQAPHPMTPLFRDLSTGNLPGIEAERARKKAGDDARLAASRSPNRRGSVPSKLKPKPQGAPPQAEPLSPDDPFVALRRGSYTADAEPGFPALDAAVPPPKKQPAAGSKQPAASRPSKRAASPQKAKPGKGLDDSRKSLSDASFKKNPKPRRAADRSVTATHARVLPERPLASTHSRGLPRSTSQKLAPRSSAKAAVPKKLGGSYPSASLPAPPGGDADPWGGAPCIPPVPAFGEADLALFAPEPLSQRPQGLSFATGPGRRASVGNVEPLVAPNGGSEQGSPLTASVASEDDWLAQAINLPAPPTPAEMEQCSQQPPQRPPGGGGRAGSDRRSSKGSPVSPAGGKDRPAVGPTRLPLNAFSPARPVSTSPLRSEEAPPAEISPADATPSGAPRSSFPVLASPPLTSPGTAAQFFPRPSAPPDVTKELDFTGNPYFPTAEPPAAPAPEPAADEGQPTRANGAAREAADSYLTSYQSRRDLVKAEKLRARLATLPARAGPAAEGSGEPDAAADAADDRSSGVLSLEEARKRRRLAREATATPTAGLKLASLEGAHQWSPGEGRKVRRPPEDFVGSRRARFNSSPLPTKKA